MKWDFKMVVLIVEWSKFWGGLKAGFYCNCISGVLMGPYPYWYSPPPPKKKVHCIHSQLKKGFQLIENLEVGSTICFYICTLK